jgi:hypothetical protein
MKMKILLRYFYSCAPVARWRVFEAMLRRCLHELGHEIIELEFDPSLPPDPPEAQFKILPHKCKRDAPSGDLFYKEMHMQGLFTIDHLGWGSDHSGLLSAPDLSGIDAKHAEAFCFGLREQFLSTGRSKHRQPPLRTIDIRLKPYVLAPLQSPGDESVVFHSPIGVLEYIDVLSDWAEKARHNVVFKLHPGMEFPDVAAAVGARAASGRQVFVVDENIHALIAASEAVVVISSGVGFESLIHGKPVVTLGNPDYRWVTCRAKAEELDSALTDVKSYRPGHREAAYKFVYFYYHKHAYLTSGAAVEKSALLLLEYLRKVVGIDTGLRRFQGQAAS